MVHGLIQPFLEHSGNSAWICSVFSYVLEQVSNIILREKIWIISVTARAHHTNGDRFDWSISGHQSINPSREVTSILSSSKHKRFTFFHPVVNSNFHVL